MISPYEYFLCSNRIGVYRRPVYKGRDLEYVMLFKFFKKIYDILFYLDFKNPINTQS